MFDGNKKPLLALLLFVIIAFSGFSQADYRPGYLLLAKNDTLFGLIDNNSDVSNSKICRFKKSENEPVQEFLPKIIFGYKIIDGKYYLSKDVLVGTQAESRFLECLVEGTLSLYFYRSGLEDHYLLEKAELPLKEISVPDNIIYENNVALKREYLINRALVRYYMQDCPEMGREIDKIKVPSHLNLIKLVKKYLELKCPNDVCLIYQKKKNKFRMDIQPVFGITKYSAAMVNGNIGATDFTPQYGLLTYTWLPLTDEKLFFRGGLLVAEIRELKYHLDLLSITFSEEQHYYYKVPLQLQYIFLKRRISPTLGGGVTFLSTKQLSFGVLPSFNVGINGVITEKFYLSLFADYDYYFNPDISGNTDTYSFNLGLTYKL